MKEITEEQAKYLDWCIHNADGSGRGDKMKLFEIGEMLQRLIDFWRNSDEEYAKYYVDAYRCVQENIKSILRGSFQKVNEEVR